MTPIFTYTYDSEMKQRATSPPFKSVNEHEGLALLDIDGDGKKDIVGGVTGSSTSRATSSKPTRWIQAIISPVPGPAN